MPTIGNIVEDGKLLVPVYVEGEGSTSTGPITDEEGKIIYSPATVAAVGGFCNSELYALIIDQGGNISSVKWDRTSDPIITSTQTQLPPTSIPNASGFLITVDPIISGQDNGEIILPQPEVNKETVNAAYNIINIYEYGDNPPTTGRYVMDSECYISTGYFALNHASSYPSISQSSTDCYKISFASPLQFKVINHTSKNLSFQMTGSFTNNTLNKFPTEWTGTRITTAYSNPPNLNSITSDINSLEEQTYSYININFNEESVLDYDLKSLSTLYQSKPSNTWSNNLSTDSVQYGYVNWGVQLEFILIVKD